MIKMKLLSGPHNGAVRIIPSDIKPSDLINQLVGHGWQWQIDYSQASDQEKFDWCLADTVGRILRALLSGRPVQFMDMRWQIKPGDDVIELVGKVEDYISESGKLIKVIQDNENGLIIKTFGPEDFDPNDN